MIIASLFFGAFISLSATAQCNCSPGVPATPIVQSITIAPTTASQLTFSFPQFNPAIGTLSCVTLKDTITAVSTTGALNTGGRTPAGYTGPPVSTDSTIFSFLLALTNQVSGPGINISNSFTKNYGPDTLSYFGTTGDSITYGPDNIINNPYGTASTGGNSAYLGTGTVPFVYTINGGMISTQGGPNYTATVHTIYGGTLNLTYYWCPAVVLANNITNFTAFIKDKNAELQWTVENEITDVTYEIEYSTDGSHYQPVGYTQSTLNGDENDAVNYRFQYPLNNTASGKIFFRIKRTTQDGKSTYTAIKTINLDGSGMAGYQVYPNPVHNSVMLEFAQAQSANFVVSLISTAGQLIQQKQVTLNGNNQIRMDLNSQPATGLYYLQARDQTHNQQYITKVLIK